MELFPSLKLRNTKPAVVVMGRMTDSGFTALAWVERKIIVKTISMVFFLFMVFFQFSGSVFALSFEVNENHIINQRLEKYVKLGLLPDIYSYHTKTSDLLQLNIEHLQNTNAVFSDDIAIFNAYLQNFNGEGFQVFPFIKLDMLSSNADFARTLETDAIINPLLNQNDAGRFLSSGSYMVVEPRLVLGFGSVLTLDLKPRLVTKDFDDAKWQWFEYSAKLRYRNLELSIGQMHFAWGQMRYSRMLFGGSQKPLPMIRLQNSQPVTLNGFLSFLGQGRFTLFASKMDNTQTLGGNWIIGERIAFAISPRFEFGITQSIQIGGNGYPDVPWYENAAEIAGYRFNAKETNFTNRNAQLDFRYKIPKLSNLNLFGEFFFEDCCNINFDKDIGNALGIEMVDIEPKFHTTLGFEYLRTTYVYNRHAKYLSGFIYDGVSLGHHVGADSVGHYMYMLQSIAPKIDHELAFAFEIRQAQAYDQRKRDITVVDPSFENREYRYRTSYTLTMQHQFSFSSRFSLGHEFVQNFDYINDQDKNFFVARYQLEYSF